MEFIIIDRNERQWLASLESTTGFDIPAKFNNFFIKKKTIEKNFNGRLLSRDEWVIIIERIDDLLQLRKIAPNGFLSIGELWDLPAIYI